MTFVTPLAWVGLLLLPVIVALHLRRSSVREVEVPSLMLWEGLAAPAGAGGKHWRIEQLLALLLQLAAVVLMIMSLAAPTGQAGNASSRVYVLDAGILMSVPDPAPSRMAAAQSDIVRDMQSAPSGTTFSIIAGGPVPRLIVSTTDQATAVRQMHAVVSIGGSPNLQQAVGIAAGVIPARGGHLVLVYARGDTAPVVPPWISTVTRFIVGQSTNNQSIASLRIRCQLNASSCEALAAVKNDAASAVKEVIAIDTDSVRLGRETLTLPAQSVTDLSFPVPANRQLVQLYLNRPDLVASDNLAWAVIPHDSLGTVLVIGEARQVAPITRALSAMRAAHITTLTPAQFSAGNASGADLLILAGWAPQGRLPAAPSILLINPPTYPGSTAPRPLADATVSGVDGASPLLTGLDLTSLDVPAGSARLLALPPALLPIVWTAGGPLIAAGTIDGSRVATVDFDPSIANFSQLPAFPLFFANVARWSGGWLPPTAIPGGQISAEAPASTTSVAVTRAADLTATRAPVADAVIESGQLHVAITVPGIYTITERGVWGSRAGTVVANTATGDPADLAAPAAAPTALRIDPGAPATASWWPILALVAALLLIAELFATLFGGDR